MHSNDNSSPFDLSKHIYAGTYEHEPSEKEILLSYEEMSRLGEDLLPKAYQTKLKKEFVGEFANNRLEMSNAAFFILDKLTIFADVDFSIVINIEDFRRFINMSQKTFKRALDYILERKYLVWDTNLCKYFLTEKSHTLVTAVAEGEPSSSRHYIQTLHITDWSKFNQLTAIQQRFLYHLVNRTSFQSHKDYEFEIQQLLHVRVNSQSNTQYTEISSLSEMFRAFEKFHAFGFFSAELKVEATNETWASTGDFEDVQLQEYVDKYEPYLNEYVIFIKLDCLYKHTSLDNINNLFLVEHLLRQHAPYKVEDYLKFPLINRTFKTVGPLDNQIEINKVISLKKSLINSISIENKKEFIHLYNFALAEFIHDNFYRLHLLAQEEFAIFNAFKDFYFNPALLRVIKDTLPLVIPSVINDGNKNLIIAPSYKIAMTKNNYERLLQFYADNSNSINLIAIRHELKERIANYSTDVMHAQSVKTALFQAYGGFRAIQDKADEKLQTRFRKAVAKYKSRLNVSFEAFANITSFITHKVKKHDDLLILKMIEKMEKFIAKTKQAQLASKDALDHKNVMFKMAKDYPYKLLTSLMKNGVSNVFVELADNYITNYYQELPNTVKFIYRDSEGNISPQVAEINSKYTHNQIVAKECLGMGLSPVEERMAVYSRLDSELRANPASKYIVLDVIIDEENIQKLQTQLQNTLLELAQSENFHTEQSKKYFNRDIEERFISFERHFNIDKNFQYNGGFHSEVLEAILESATPVRNLTNTQYF